jgi:hypothetical protein
MGKGYTKSAAGLRKIIMEFLGHKKTKVLGGSELFWFQEKHKQLEKKRNHQIRMRINTRDYLRVGGA